MMVFIRSAIIIIVKFNNSLSSINDYSTSNLYLFVTDLKTDVNISFFKHQCYKNSRRHEREYVFFFKIKFKFSCLICVSKNPIVLKCLNLKP